MEEECYAVQKQGTSEIHVQSASDNSSAMDEGVREETPNQAATAACAEEPEEEVV